MTIEQKYLKLVKEIKDTYTLIDNLKILIATDLLELETIYKTEELDYPSFKSLVLDLIGRSYSRVLPLLRIAHYINKQNIDSKELLNISITHIEVVAKADVKWSETTKQNLSSLSYKLLKDKYK